MIRIDDREMAESCMNGLPEVTMNVEDLAAVVSKARESGERSMSKEADKLRLLGRRVQADLLPVADRLRLLPEEERSLWNHSFFVCVSSLTSKLLECVKERLSTDAFRMADRVAEGLDIERLLCLASSRIEADETDEGFDE